MIASHLPTPAKPSLLINALFILAILLTFACWGFVMAYNTLYGWIGLFVVSPYAAYQCHKRLHTQSRLSFWVAYWLFLGLPFTLNALYVSPWWWAFWPVSFIYIYWFSVCCKWINPEGAYLLQATE